MSTLRILHLTTYIGLNSYGIGPVVVNLSKIQQSSGHYVEIWSCDNSEEGKEIEKYYSLNTNTIQTYNVLGPHRLGFAPLLIKSISNRANEFDIVHQHGIWTYTTIITNKWRKLTGNPTLISPHGSLNTWALKRSVWKKRIAYYLYERENLNKSACLHALSDSEAEGIRKFGIKKPIAIIPNGISEDWLTSHGNGKAFRHRYGLSPEIKILLYIGRITPIKGLTMLLHAFYLLKNNNVDVDKWRLLIIGKDEFNHKSEIELLINQLSLSPYVIFIDSIYGQDKRDAYAAADIFVLPSFSEGSPLVILEALGAGVPVITTKTSPWEELSTNNCGWWVEANANALKNALLEGFNCSPEVLQEMGLRGKNLVSNKYLWKNIGNNMLDLYSWLLGVSDKTSFIQ